MQMDRQPGERIGAYELVKQLGAGGMGVVWEAVLHGPAGFEKAVALKLLHAGPSEQDRTLLIREARLGARLQHPNVVGVLALGEADGAWHVVMELVRGPSTAQVLRTRGVLAPDQVLDVGVQAAAGLAHIHGLVVDNRPAGLVHCDVKPENLLIDEYGVVKVADLGIASLAGERRGSAGTPGFMAPEQVDGHPEPRSDLFSLGATLYMLAVGRRPFDRNISGLLKLEDRLDQPDFIAPVESVVPGLGPILVRCLRANPSDRFESVRALGLALAQLRSTRPVGINDAITVVRTPSVALSAPTLVTNTDSFGPVGNVVAPRDRFVGREEELAAVCALARSPSRLVTLLAMGGTGKTRLATEVALQLRDELEGGAWMVELADARTEDEICAAVAATFSVALDRTDPTSHLGRVLAAKEHALFVLDNLEQCIDPIRPMVARWLELAPSARLLCTSRIPLKLRGEHPVDLGSLTPADAMALFRARAPSPIPAAHDEELAALCADLEGMPLALELAAARLRMMSVAQIRKRLTRGFGLLAGGSSEMPDRHRSLEASIRWSWELLSANGRAALAQLSVFVGGFTLEAAEAVLDTTAVGATGWALDVVQELSDASLVRAERDTGRLFLLPVVLAFAGEQLEASERAAAEGRHAAFFAQLGAPGVAERLDPQVLALEVDNLIVASRRVLDRNDGRLAVPLVLVCAGVIDRTGPHDVAADLMRRALQLPTLERFERAEIALSAARACLVTGQGESADTHLRTVEEAASPEQLPQLMGRLRANQALRLRQQGRVAEAEQRYTDALAILEGLGDMRQLARVISSRGGMFHEQGRDEEARRWFERSIALRRSVGDRHGEAMDLANLANIAQAQSRQHEALAYQQASLEAYRSLGDRRGEAQILGDIGLSLHALGRESEAEAQYHGALALHRRAGNRRFEGIVSSNLGLFCLDNGRLDDAELHIKRAIELHRQVGNLRSEGIAMGLLGRHRDLKDRLPEAELLLRTALDLHRAAGNRPWEARALRHLARLVVRLGRPGEASALYDASIALWTSLGDTKRADETSAERVGAPVTEGA